MKKIIECVPNYSVGNNPEILNKICQPFHDEAEVKLLSVEPDDDYNRTVVTLIGEPQAVLRALAKSCVLARDLIDLRKHHGQHKRMGAVDVVPLIPLANLSEQETISYSQQLAEMINQASGIPVFLYSLSATAENRRNLPDIREGEFEGMFEKTKLPQWQPDYGSGCHPSAGVVAVGCRPLLVAYNIDLNCSDRKIAAAIAKAIRYSSGGYRCIQAGAARLADQGIVQVTMNITDYRQTALYRAFEAVKMEAKRYGVQLSGSEVVGLISLDCLQDVAAYYLGLNCKDDCQLPLNEVVEVVKKALLLRDFDERKVIEYYL